MQDPRIWIENNTYFIKSFYVKILKLGKLHMGKTRSEKARCNLIRKDCSIVLCILIFKCFQRAYIFFQLEACCMFVADLVLSFPALETNLWMFHFGGNFWNVWLLWFGLSLEKDINYQAKEVPSFPIHKLYQKISGN